jgi:cell division protein FtsN
MVDRETDSGLELVLDNRKLILMFAVFIAICGCFFVLGFIEGKRQGFQAGSQAAAESAPKTSSETAQAVASKPAGPDTSAKPPDESDPQLNWYKNVNRRAGEPEIEPPPPAANPAKGKVTPAPAAASKTAKKAVGPAPVTMPSAKPKLQASAARSESVSYSVQVGAFSKRHEAELRAKALRSKGYDSRIESPSSTNQLFLVKVGKFSSRAEAVAMQLRLKKSNFTSFVKTN